MKSEKVMKISGKSQVQTKAKRFDKIIAVMPAYNAELTLEKTFRDIPAGFLDEVILIDD